MTVVAGYKSLDLGLVVVTGCFELQQGWGTPLGENEDEKQKCSWIMIKGSSGLMRGC